MKQQNAPTYVKANRSKTMQAYTSKLAALDIATLRLSVPAHMVQEYTRMAEGDRAAYFADLAESEPDGSERLALLAKSNRVRILSNEEAKAAAAAFSDKAAGARALSTYTKAAVAMMELDSAAAAKAAEGDDAAAIRLAAKTFVASCFLKIAQSALLQQND